MRIIANYTVRPVKDGFGHKVESREQIIEVDAASEDAAMDQAKKLVESRFPEAIPGWGGQYELFLEPGVAIAPAVSPVVDGGLHYYELYAEGSGYIDSYLKRLTTLGFPALRMRTLKHGITGHVLDGGNYFNRLLLESDCPLPTPREAGCGNCDMPSLKPTQPKGGASACHPIGGRLIPG